MVVAVETEPVTTEPVTTEPATAEPTTRNEHTLIPQLIHFLPACADHEQSWKEANPEWVHLYWDTEALERVRTRTPGLKRLTPAQAAADMNIVYILTVLYNFGGVVVNEPTPCAHPLVDVLRTNQLSMLITFLDSADCVEPSIIFCSPKINAFIGLFDVLVTQAGKQQGLFDTFTGFVVSAKRGSAENAIVCLPREQLFKLTGRSVFDDVLSAVEGITFRVMGSGTEWTTRLAEWMTGRGARAGDDAGVLVFDSPDFCTEQPVQAALQLAVAFQDVDPPDVLIIGSCVEETASLDMMVRPQLQLLSYQDTHHDGFTVWKRQ